MRQRRLFLVVIGLLAVLILSQSGFTPVAAAKGPPAKVFWTEKVVTGTAAPGTSTTGLTATFTPTKDISTASLRLTPSLKETVAVTVGGLPLPAVLPANTSVTLDIVFTAPLEGNRHTFNGTLHVRDGNRTLAQPLKLRFKVVAPPTP